MEIMHFEEYQSDEAPSNKLPYWFLGVISLVTVAAAVLIWTCHANVEPGPEIASCVMTVIWRSFCRVLSLLLSPLLSSTSTTS